METTTHYTPTALPAARLHRWWLRAVLFEHGGDAPVSVLDDDDATPDATPATPSAHGIGGCWGLHIVEGSSGGVLLDGLNAMIVVEAAADRKATQALYIDAEANLLQREALEAILSGRGGGGFEQLAAHVTRRAGTRYVPITWTDDGTVKALRVSGVTLPTAQAPRHGRRPLPGGSSVPPRTAPQRGNGTAPQRGNGTAPQRRSSTVEIRSDGVSSLCNHVFWHGTMAGL